MQVQFVRNMKLFYIILRTELFWGKIKQNVLLTKDEMVKINIVLHEPEIPQNTGNIARTCAITGAALHLIRPLGFRTDDRTLKRAGLDYWDKLEVYYYDSLEDFMTRHEGCQFFCFSTKSKKSYTEAEYPDDCFLIFGKETKGLPEKFLLDHFDRCVRIPMKKTLRSLNLSNSVAIGVYEVLRQHGFDGMEEESDYWE